MAAKRK